MILHGKCAERLASMPACAVDFVLTDPPYIVKYRARDGRTVANDDNAAWLKPSFTEIHRVLKNDCYAVSFYGWNAADTFLQAWRAAGFVPVEHIVFPKHYASSTRHMERRHEQAYVLAKGHPRPPPAPISDIVEGWRYTGNKLHPTQKPVGILKPVISSLCPQGGTVLDPFCGSGSTLVAALRTGRKFIGIDMEAQHIATAQRRIEKFMRPQAA